MQKYVIRRLLLAVPVLLLSSVIVFGLMRVMPGDALIALMGESGNVGQKELAKLRKDLGLDRPYYEQYGLWLWQMVSLNPGDSIFTNEPIPVSLKKAIPVTLELATLAMIIGLAIAVPVGVLSATRQDKPSDYVGRVVAVSGLSIPDFWLGTLVITFAAIWVHWIPPIGYVSIFESPWRNLQQFLLPAAVLGFRLSAATMRMTRSTVLETLREDYVRTAWAKGLAGRIVVYKHALKNALIPVVTIIGGQLGVLLAGTVVVEQIFALPGMGRLTVEAILYRDYPVVQTNVMLVATTLVITFAAIWVQWIPPIGYVSFWDSPGRNLQQFLLPAAILGYRLSSATMRMTRSTVLETLREDYVRTAWAKGLAGRIVVYKHALKNALIPVVTIVGGQLGTLLAGTFVVEQIFALPGMGRLTVEAILYRDYPVVQTNVMLVAATLVTLNLIVDLTYAWLDPRIRYQ